MRRATLNLIMSLALAAGSSACLGDEESAAPLYSTSFYGADGYYCPACPAVILAHCNRLALLHGGHGHGGFGHVGHGHGGHGGHH
jgi:hypothetical protein